MATGVPAALQSAMHGPQDSKPFTYLPGGIDFSELRSPRMAKRLAQHKVSSGQTNDGDPKPSLPFGSARGASVPRLPGPGDVSTTTGLPPKPQFKKQKSITDLLCMPDTEPTVFSTPFTQPVQQQQQQHQQSSSPKIGKDPYNPYIQYKDDYQKSLTSPQPPQNYNVQPVISNYYPVTFANNDDHSHENGHKTPTYHQAVKAPEPPKAPIAFNTNYQNQEEKKEAPKPPPMPPVKVEPRPSATLPPPAPRGPPGRAPPAPPPPPPPGYLTEDLPEIGSSKQKTKRGKVGLVQAQLEQEKEEKREEDRLRREREERERREREERERREREELERQIREEQERREREELERQIREERERREREERERREREEQERREREEMERQIRQREEMERREREELERREKEREALLRFERDTDERRETALLLERQLRENEELERRRIEIEREIERIRREQEREEIDSRGKYEAANGSNGIDHYHDDTEDEFPWTHTISDMEIMEKYEEEPKVGVEIPVGSYKMDITEIKIPPPPPPPPPPHQAAAFVRPPPAPPAPSSSKSRRAQLASPTPGEYAKKALPPISIPPPRARENIPPRFSPSPPSAPTLQQPRVEPSQQRQYYDKPSSPPPQQQFYEPQGPKQQHYFDQPQQQQQQQQHYQPQYEPHRQQRQAQPDFFASMMQPREEDFFTAPLMPTFPQFFNAPDPFLADFAPALTPMFAKPQIPLAPSAVKPVPRQQPDGGRVIPIQIESKANSSIPKSTSYDSVDKVSSPKPSGVRREIRIKVERTPPPTPTPTPTPTPPPSRGNPMKLSNPVAGLSRNNQMDNVMNEIGRRPISLKSNPVRQQSLQDDHDHDEDGRDEKGLIDIEQRILINRRASEPPDARKAVMGEFATFAGGRPSRIAGRKKPSQSPSMWLLGRTYIRKEGEDEEEDQLVEGTGVSKEYTGDQGRYLPPKAGRPNPQDCDPEAGWL